MGGLLILTSFYVVVFETGEFLKAFKILDF